ncbi:MAG: TRAP transporter small permease [Peptoniphilus sp.]|uniref:C4-dicarboxylate ABC transporter n=1 Tax=Peptoniphilus porci TaxID=2652280 RepID=A0A1U7M0Y0_9FIRM|nr:MULTISPECIES: TRAP transporter small permease [Peptoniphilus]MCI5644053.1 TRAP transporter small permease [Peptoniphilus sp.]OLR65293.1 C4-dicarboxylate ABC transporter [Peptoniphilus porci]
MRNCLKKFNKIEEIVLVSSLVINVAIVFMQVIMRYFFNTSLAWSEELSRYIFIWQVWLGSSIAYVDNQHIRVDLIFSIFKSKKVHKILHLIINIIWLTFNVFLVYVGIKLLKSMSARNALSSGMRLPLVYVYSALPVSSFILVFRIFFDTIDTITGKKEGIINNEEIEEI